MNLLNEMTLHFESRSCNEGFARAAVGAFVAQLDPTIGEMNDIRTAVSEAVTNCVVHAYRDTIGPIRINVKLTADHVVIIRIHDNGIGIEDVAQAMEPLYTTAPGEDRAGLGFAVMQSFADSVTVRSKPHKGTTVTLRKAIARRVNHG